MINKEEVGQRIKMIRLSKGDTLEDFGIRIAMILNISKQNAPIKGNISRWESGLSLPNKERLKAIADIGEITVEELLYGQKSRTAEMGLKEYLIYKLDEYIQEAFPQTSEISNLISNLKVYSSENDYSKNNKKHAKIIKDIGKEYVDVMYYSDITLETLQTVSSGLTIENFLRYRENAWYEFKSFLDKKVFELRFNSEKDVLYLIKTLFIDKFENKLLTAIEQFDDSDELNQFIFEEIEPVLNKASEKIISVSNDVIN